MNYGPTSYGALSIRRADGGDGQVGVVGDGDNQMEKFDQTAVVKRELSSNAIGGKDSKSAKTKVAFEDNGYAADLKNKGMTDVDNYGEDRLYQRRQQLENCNNQQEVKAQRDAVRQYQVETAALSTAAAPGEPLLDGNAKQEYKGKYKGRASRRVSLSRRSALEHATRSLRTRPT